MNHRAKVITLCAGLVAAGCFGRNATEPVISGSGKKILFIGNSLTYTNDVPGLLQALADAAGPEPLAVAMTAGPDLALIDHWNNQSTARHDIGIGGWSYIVLQQGGTPAGVCRDTLRLATQYFAGDAAKVGAKIAMYQTWMSSSYPQHTPGTIRTYELAAEDVSGVLFPAAAAFRAALVRDSSIFLISDGLHATPAGSYLVALVMYATLFDRTPVGLPSHLKTLSGFIIDIPLALAATLQEAAADVTIRHLGGSNGEDGPAVLHPGTC